MPDAWQIARPFDAQVEAGETEHEDDEAPCSAAECDAPKSNHALRQQNFIR
jgi:hypothetical protein